MKKYWETLRQFLLFNMVGLLNTGVDFLVFYLLTGPLGLGDALSKTVSYSCGVLNSYFLNSRLTFKSERKRTRREFLLFVLVNLVSYGASLLLLYLSREHWGVGDSLLRNLIATPVSVLLNYAGNKFIVFKKKEGTGAD